jgi:ribosomal protein S7
MLKKHNSSLFDSTLNNIYRLLLKKGKFSSSRSILFYTIKNLKKHEKVSGRESLAFIQTCLDDSLFRFVIRSRSKGKIREEIPLPVYSKKKLYSLTVRNILDILRKNKGSSISSFLTNEFLELHKSGGQLKVALSVLNKKVILNRKFLNN